MSKHIASRLKPGGPRIERGVLAGVLLPGLLLAGLLPSSLRTARSGEEPNPPFRIGFSSSTLGDVNENDASAAIRVWAQSLAQQRGIPADPQPRMLRNADEIVAGLTNKAIDAISMTTEEYVMVRDRVPLQHYVVSVQGGAITEEYVLLVRRDSGVRRLQDLRSGKLGLLQSARASLAPAWLETLLAREKLGAPREFFGRIESAPKITKAILPVFFGQLDACVVTRRGFDLMVEMNPQTGQQLSVLSASQPMVPVVFCFRADYAASIQTKLLEEIGSWHTTPAGGQILNLFQCDRLEEHPKACLDSALELLDSRARLAGRTGRSPVSRTVPGGDGEERERPPVSTAPQP